MSDFAELRHLLQAYLNLDWPDEYATAADAVADFARDEPDQVPEVRSQVAEILAASKSEDELRSLLVDELGSGYWPPGDGMTFAEWLVDLRAQLELRGDR